MRERKLIQCIAIDKTYIYTLCTNFFCPHAIHKYGSGNDLKDRFENRVSHCDKDRLELIIRIDETTVRSSIKTFKNKKKIQFIDKNIWE